MMTKAEASRKFLELVDQYGLGWNDNVPAQDYQLSDKISRVLSLEEKMNLLKLRVPR
jgi:hypothetical protein